MAYAFLDDGGPEAEEYDSNYYYFDASNTDAVAAIERMLTSRAKRNSAFRSEFERICRQSFDRPAKRETKNLLANWVGGIRRIFARPAQGHA